jgi:hypothetical protein
MILTRIISGGQTGADIAGIRAAKRVGLETGGCLPRGCGTLDGPRREYIREYGMHEHRSSSYVFYGPLKPDEMIATASADGCNGARSVQADLSLPPPAEVRGDVRRNDGSDCAQSRIAHTKLSGSSAP